MRLKMPTKNTSSIRWARPAFLLLWKLSYLPLLTACYMLVSFLLRKIYRMEQSRDTLRFLPFLLVQLVLLMLPLTMVQNAMGHYKSLIPVMLLAGSTL